MQISLQITISFSIRQIDFIKFHVKYNYFSLIIWFYFTLLAAIKKFLTFLFQKHGNIDKFLIL